MDFIQQQLSFIRRLVSVMAVLMTVVTLYFPSPEGEWVFNEKGRG